MNGLNKQKRKRRSKNDSDGRSFKCVECGKSYLSMPALTNHRKTKHDFGKDGEKKGRGRPRKNVKKINISPLYILRLTLLKKNSRPFLKKKFAAQHLKQ
jgi:hypothetical protein